MVFYRDARVISALLQPINHGEWISALEQLGFQGSTHVEQRGIKNRDARALEALEALEVRSLPTSHRSVDIRGEDDPRTLQAIDEGRRLYVQTLPYMARRGYIGKLFARNGYEM